MIKGRIAGTQIVANRCVVTLETMGDKGLQTRTLSFKAGVAPDVALAMVRAEIDDANEAERLDGLRQVFEEHIAKGTVFGDDAPLHLSDPETVADAVAVDTAS